MRKKQLARLVRKLQSATPRSLLRYKRRYEQGFKRCSLYLTDGRSVRVRLRFPEHAHVPAAIKKSRITEVKDARKGMRAAATLFGFLSGLRRAHIR